MNNGLNIPEYEVSQFNRLFKEVVETNFDYVRIRGEISELKKAASGHLYLTLKDKDSILNATIWKQKKNYIQLNPEVGMEVVVTGKISTYAKSISTYSISIDKLELAGEGALLKLIEDRKKKLQSQGIFDDIHKKKIPYFPKKIGVITSPTGSVIHDIINRIKDRCPTNIDIWPVSVQGVVAAENIINAIKGFHNATYDLKPDIIIIARGGGSTEDLMPFNDENLALAVHYSIIPIISAVGHETDTTLIDYVSDLRASTPTAAAEKAVPMLIELEQSISNSAQRLNYSIDNNLNSTHKHLVNLSKFLKEPIFIISSFKEKFKLMAESLSREWKNLFQENCNKLENFSLLLRPPHNNFKNHKKYLSNTIKNFNRNINDLIDSRERELNKFVRLLDSNSIHGTLNKGYSIVRKSKKIINKADLIKSEDVINIQFIDKTVELKIKKIN
jgi:exodeoxyribonuclease VII large subunit